MSAAVQTDTTLAAAADQARASPEGIAEPGAVGDHLGLTMVGERLGTPPLHLHLRGGIPGVAVGGHRDRVPVRAKVATVCDQSVPGDGAALSSLVPYAGGWLPVTSDPAT